MLNNILRRDFEGEFAVINEESTENSKGNIILDKISEFI